MRPTLTTLALKLGNTAGQYDHRGSVQRMLSDGTVSSANRNSLTSMIGEARRDVAYNEQRAADVPGVTRELTTWRHALPQGENVVQQYATGPIRESSPQQYSTGPLRENSRQRYTQMIEVPPSPSAVADRVAVYAQQAARAQLALGTLVEVKDAVVAQLAEQPALVSAWEALKDNLKAG